MDILWTVLWTVLWEYYGNTISGAMGCYGATMAHYSWYYRGYYRRLWKYYGEYYGYTIGGAMGCYGATMGALWRVL